MTDKKIPGYLVALAREHPRHPFPWGDYIVQWSSTCTYAPACWPMPDNSRDDTKGKLYEGVTVRYELCLSGGFTKSEAVTAVADHYGVTTRTIQTAISTFKKSE